MGKVVLDDRYKLLEPIGKGGEARVFRAREISSGEEVAIRLGLTPARFTAPKNLPRFRSSWVAWHRSGVDAKFGAYHVLELLDGKTLDQIVETAPLDPTAWRQFVSVSLAAVGALHAENFVHGDLHAGNFLRLDSPKSKWKLLELPFLRFETDTPRSALFGSIHTLAPEQLDRQVATYASDLYSLGCLYYYAACGRYPHPGRTEAEIAVARLREKPMPLGDLAPNFPPDSIRAVMQLLSRRPIDRCSASILADLE